MSFADEEKVIKYGLRIGNYWHVILFYLYGGFSYTEWGNEKLVLHFLKRMNEVSEAFENIYTVVQWHRLNGYYSIKFRKLGEFLKISEESLNLSFKSKNTLTLLLIHCCRSIAFSFRKEPVDAKASLAEAKNLIKDLKAPLAIIHYLIAKSYIEIAGMTDNQVGIGARKALLKTTRDIIKHSQKARANLTEAYRLRAVACSMLNKPAMAAENFKRSIQAGISYGGDLELSRTYFEAGKFLRDPKNKISRILGMNGTECLLKAQALFVAMNLQWDLAEYERYMGNQAAR